MAAPAPRRRQTLSRPATGLPAAGHAGSRSVHEPLQIHCRRVGSQRGSLDIRGMRSLTSP